MEKSRQALQLMRGSLQVDVDWVGRSRRSVINKRLVIGVERYAGVLELSVSCESLTSKLNTMFQDAVPKSIMCWNCLSFPVGHGEEPKFADCPVAAHVAAGPPSPS